MIEFTYTEVFNFEGAIRGARNSWESHAKSDSFYEPVEYYGGVPLAEEFKIGSNDHALLMKLSKAGSSHAKFMRQILVCVDINAPLYWWKEFDQYKVGTVTNSESTMHTIQRKPMEKDLFALDIPLGYIYKEYVDDILGTIELLRKDFIQTKNKEYWKLLIQLLPSGWMQKRTTTLNYAVIQNAYHDRKNHRLSEWHDFCNWSESLPYSELITGEMK